MESPLEASTPQSTLADNRRLILHVLQTGGELTRQEIQEATGLSSAATARITARLEADQLIARSRLAPSSGGRPAWRYLFSATGRYLAGLRIQEDGCRGILTAWDQSVMARVEVGVDPGSATPQDLLEATRHCAREIVAQSRARGREPLAIGVAFPGVVTGGDLVHPAVEVDWGDLALGGELSAETGVRVVVENDANLLAISEMIGQESVRSLAALILGHGVGAGILTEGRLLRGFTSSAGEIGFLPTVASRLGSPTAAAGDLEGQVHRALRPLEPGDSGGSPRLWELLKHPMPGARVEEALDYLAMAIGSLIVVLDPERIVLGDVPEESARLLIDPLERRVRGLRPHVPEIVTARQGSDAVLMGAVALASDQVDLQAH